MQNSKEILNFEIKEWEQLPNIRKIYLSLKIIREVNTTSSVHFLKYLLAHFIKKFHKNITLVLMQTPVLL